MVRRRPTAVPARVEPLPTPGTGADPFGSEPLPRSVQTGTLVHRDQPYVPGEACPACQRFDIHLPDGCSTGGMPMVVWIPGDPWWDGAKADCPIAWLAGEGYVVASIGYRRSDTALFPAQLEDCRQAIATLARDAEVWGIDPGRIAVVGSGGGGHLAALVGLSAQPTGPRNASDADDDEPPGHVAAICAVAAPTSLTTLGPEQDRPGSSASRLVGGPLPEFREAARRASPVAHVSADDPPVLLVHGTRDTVVPLGQALELEKALADAGVEHTLVTLADFGHKLALGPGTPAGQALLLFLDRTLGPGNASGAAARP